MYAKEHKDRFRSGVTQASPDAPGSRAHQSGWTRRLSCRRATQHLTQVHSGLVGISTSMGREPVRRNKRAEYRSVVCERRSTGRPRREVRQSLVGRLWRVRRRLEQSFGGWSDRPRPLPPRHARCSSGSILEQVRAAWKKLNLELHPDQNPLATAADRARMQDRLMLVNNAYDILKRAKTRSA
jgi:hypothetical protein